MLDINTLSQLKQLKQTIEDSKEYAEGLVKGTQRKFGFVVLDDGREIYLSPEQILKVFPGDRVKVLINTEGKPAKKGAKAKVSAVIEALVDSPLQTFTGRYVVKGQGHFVEPDLPRLSRWIFIPPAARKNAKHGDYIRCKISRHPYPGAKPQAKVLQHIGTDDKIGIEADYIVSKYQLEAEWPQGWQQQLNEVDHSHRQDLTELPFVTIDAASTQDMDDALFASTTDQGWQLQVAIADPTALVSAGSALDLAIEKQGTSAYLPSRSIAMLPRELANDLCSLAAEQIRPVLVCSMAIDKQGNITDYTFAEATIRSQAKLSYIDVARWLAADDKTAELSEALSDCHQQQQTLASLQQISSALRQNREQKNLLIQGRQDYRLLLNEQRKLERIEVQTKLISHVLVEECMVATNRCAADMLGDSGVFISHGGFRKERLADVRKLAEEQLSLTDVDFSSLEGYQQLIKGIDDSAIEFPLRSVLSRLLQRSLLSSESHPHQGMGLASYTTFTSPIRKYSDFLVHRIIKTRISKQPDKSQPAVVVDQARLDKLLQTQDNARRASNEMEQWLKCQFIAPMVGQTFAGQVSQINSNGFTVRLDDNFIEGFVETRQLKDKYSFDPMRLRLSSKQLTIELDQAIEVSVLEVDSQQRSIRFTLPQVLSQTSPQASQAPAEKEPEQKTEEKAEQKLAES